MLKDIDHQKISQYRHGQIAGDDVGFVTLELITRTETYSDTDPMGRESSEIREYLTIPARVVWATKDRRVMNREGGYFYVRSEVTVDSVPAFYNSYLEQARILLVPRTSEYGLSNNQCRIVEISRDGKSDTLSIYCRRDKIPS